MARLLIFGNPRGPLTAARGPLGLAGGHEIHWFSAHPAPFAHVTSHTLPGWGRAPLARLVLEPIYLQRTLAAVQPDLVHVHYASKGLAALALARWRGPLVVTAMGSDILPTQGLRLPYTPFTRLLLNRADAITAKSGWMDAALLKIGPYRQKLHRITWGIDLERFRPELDTTPLRLRWEIPPRDLVFLDPRGGSAFYNKHIILNAFADYVQGGGPAATLIVTEVTPDAGFMARLRRQAKDLGIASRVRFVGQVSHTEMAEFFALADITVMMPESDGLPQSLLEALACGSFPVLGDLPQYAEVVQDGQTAKLARVGDQNALRAALRWAAENGPVRQQARARGRAYVEQHANVASETEKLLALYEKLLARRS